MSDSMTLNICAGLYLPTLEQISLFFLILPPFPGRGLTLLGRLLTIFFCLGSACTLSKATLCLSTNSITLFPNFRPSRVVS